MFLRRTASALLAFALGVALAPAIAQADGSPYSAAVQPLAFSIGSATTSGWFKPVSGRGFHLSIPAASMSATCELDRSIDGGVTVTPITALGQQIYVFSLSGQGISEDLYEAQTGVWWELNCTTYASGPVAGKFSQ